MPELPYGAAPVPVTPIGDIPNWELRVGCRKCRRIVVLRVADLAERHGMHLPIYRVVAMLRCTGWTPEGKCRGRPESVMLAEVERRGKSRRTLREIDVLPGQSWVGRNSE
jgi:hypothetical protein